MTNIIEMNRGDSFKLNVFLTDENNNPYEMTEKDKLYFGVMLPRTKFEDAIIKKTFTKKDQFEGGIVTIEINPEDTVDLFPGQYYYAIKLNMFNSEKNIEDAVITVINKTRFIIND